MNTIRGPRLIEPGDRLPLAPCRLQGKLRRARIRRLTACQRALASGRLRGRSGAFREARSKGDQPKKGRASPARARRRHMDKREIEELREKVGCAALLEEDGWKVDVKESTRRAIKYRRDSRIVIVIHDGRGWFDPFRRQKGTCFRSPNISAPMDSLTRAIVLPRSSASCPGARMAAYRKAKGRLPPSRSVGAVAPNLGPARQPGAI